MESSPTALTELIELWLSLVKLLGRPAVQLQLWAAAGAVVATWLLAQWVTRLMRRRHARRVEAARAHVLAAMEAFHAAKLEDESIEPELSAAPPYPPDVIEDDALLQQAAEAHLGLRRRLHLFFLPLVFPLLLVLVLYPVYVFFVLQGWVSGLIADIVVVSVLYLVYRLGVGIACAWGNPARVSFYRYRLFGPLFAVLVFLLAVNTITDLSRLAQATVLALAEGWLTLGNIFVATVGFYFWILLLSLAKDLVQAAVGGRPDVNAGSLDAGLTLVQYSLVALGLFGVLRVLQVNTATIAAITGGLSIGVGFALQDVLKNFLGGIIVLFEGSVRPGDWVEIAGTEGEIDKLSIRSTVVRTFDNVEYIVPNQDWLNSTVTTFTRTTRRVRTRVPIGVSYSADPHMVQALLVETAAQHPDVLAEPPPVAPLIDFGPSSVDFVVLAWVEDAKSKGKVAGELRLRIWDALKANDIEIPFPQQDVHIHHVPASLPVGDGAHSGASGV